MIIDILEKRIKENNELYDKQVLRVQELEEKCAQRYLEWVAVEQQLSDAYQAMMKLDDAVKREVLKFDGLMRSNNAK